MRDNKKERFKYLGGHKTSMGNRIQKQGRPKQQLIKSVNLGGPESYERIIIQTLSRAGYLKNDQFSEWIRNLIREKYEHATNQQALAIHIFAELVRVHAQMVHVSTERQKLHTALTSLGYDVDWYSEKLKLIPPSPTQKKDEKGINNNINNPQLTNATVSSNTE